MTAVGKMYQSDAPVYFVAFCIWALGAFFSHDLFSAVLPGLHIAYTLLAQAVLTIIQRNLFQGRNRTGGIIALIVDGGINIGGIYFVAQRFQNTDTWAAVADATQMTFPSSIPLLIISFILGMIIAAGPEFLIRYATHGGGK